MKNTRYQIKITLKGMRPPIWRRLLISADCTMDALHCAIQTSMGWCDEHLYAFRTKNRRIEIPDPDGMWDSGWSNSPRPEDAAEICLRDVARPGDKFTYEYDFGDGWMHDILIEKAIESDDITVQKAVCLKGKRACPPEDCGGIWGYQNLLESLSTPEQKRDESERESVEWVGGEWDAEAFDQDAINRALAHWSPKRQSCMYVGICG